MNEQTEHVKLYKSGKFWASAVVGTLFSTAALGLNTVDAHADDGTATKANATPTIEQKGSTQTNQAEVTLDTAKTTAAEDATPATSQTASNSTTEQSTSAAASTQAVSSQAVSTSASQSASVDTQSAAPASATAAATQKYANETYKIDTSKSYKKATAPTEVSTMQQFMGNSGSIKVNNDQTTITLTATNETTAGWLKTIKLNGHTGVRNGTEFSFTMPTSELNSQMTGYVDVYAVFSPGMDPMVEQ
ncbi:KxYKxGKxW signal peptide domain-containing protein [Weissella minor]|uniref:KxYKxGKxW signal peptide domain-containing protein n=1 Tax=Weissella minor TaxID=1620 RepID=UPI001BAF9FF3|nr:KxYKxGKxW signal peptide domain-containing protein [Weissella minor]MBS0949414.1 KxYKxGKxW signal peptide domain-containing protein [Weissella minor]